MICFCPHVQKNAGGLPAAPLCTPTPHLLSQGSFNSLPFSRTRNSDKLMSWLKKEKDYFEALKSGKREKKKTWVRDHLSETPSFIID